MGVAEFTEIAEQKSGGKIKIKIKIKVKVKVKGYSDGQLGAEVQSISSAQGGVLEMSLVSTAAASGNFKEFALFDLPFLPGDEREAHAVLDSDVGTK